jgi:hypothetical protein
MFLICILIFFSGHKGRSNNLLKEQANVLLIINYYWAIKWCRQELKYIGEMVPSGTKKINKTFFAARGIMGIIHRAKKRGYLFRQPPI